MYPPIYLHFDIMYIKDINAAPIFLAENVRITLTLYLESVKYSFSDKLWGQATMQASHQLLPPYSLEGVGPF